MKRQYITPATTAIGLRSKSQLLAASENEYSNNQGHVRFSATEVNAEDAD